MHDLLRARVVSDPGAAHERAAATGGAVLVATGPALPRTEWMLTLAPGAVARVPEEFPVVAELVELEPATDEEVLGTVSVGFTHRPVLTRRRVERGVVLRLGLRGADLDTGGALATVLSRLLTDRAHSDRTIGVGVVGYGPHGSMGTLHGLAATETEGLAFVAAADLSPERRKAAATDFPDVAVHETAAQLATDADVDVAVVATPPALHADLARELIGAGCHVVLEKPMCLTVGDADDLRSRAAAADRVLTVHQSRRWDRDWLALRRAVDNGMLGEVFNVETFVGGYGHPCRAWHSERGRSGGAVYDWGSHHVDWILQLLGQVPDEVRTVGHKRVWHDVTNLDQLTLTMRFHDGVEATFRQSDLAAIRRPKFHVQGTLGTLEGWYRPLRSERLVPGRGYVDEVSHHAEAPVELRVVAHEAGYGLVETTLPPAPHPGWAFHRNLADHLLLDEPLAVPSEESRDVVAVLEAAHRSALAGGTTEPVAARST